MYDAGAITMRCIKQRDLPHTSLKDDVPCRHTFLGYVVCGLGFVLPVDDIYFCDYGTPGRLRAEDGDTSEGLKPRTGMV